MMNLAPNFERKCRTCGTDIAELTCGIPIFGSGLQLDQKIRRYLGLNISLYDDLPKCMCATCFIKIESIDKLAILALKTEEAYLGWLKCIRTGVAKCVSPTQMIQRTSDSMTQTFIPHIPTINKPTISVISYSDLKLGLLIKDQELLKLILKALKWAEYDRKASFEVLLQRLRNTTFREILSNYNLLNDSDLMQLLKSYIGQETFTKVQPDVSQSSISKAVTADSGGINFRLDDDNVTQMEVGVDPSLFLDDEETQSKSPLLRENNITIKLIPVSLANSTSNEKMIPAVLKYDVRKSGRYPCTNCAISFTTNVDLQQHIVAAHMSNSNQSSNNEFTDLKAIKIRVRKHRNQVKLSPVPDAVSSMSSTSTIETIPVAIAGVETTSQSRSSTTPKTSHKPRRKHASKSSAINAAISSKRTRRQIEPTNVLKSPHSAHKRQSKAIKGKYACERCDRLFRTSQNLSRHSLYHVGPKYSCDRCRKVYATSSSLKIHKITHSDVRPHKCSLCDKTFKRNQDLKFHQNQHTGARPYQCPHCSKTFASSGNCFSHRKRMHGNDESAKSEEEKQTRIAKSSRKA